MNAVKPTLLASALLLGCAPAWAAKNFNLNVDGSFVSDDNVTKADASSDVREDTFVNANGGFSYLQPLDFRSVLLYRGWIAFESYSEFDGLDNTSFNGAVDYKIQFDRGYRAPAFTLTAFLQEHDFDSDMRDSTTIGLQGTMAQRYTDRVSATYGVSLKSRESESDTFDNDTTRLFANFDWVANERFVGYGTLQYVTGDIVSTATPTIDIIDAADSIEADDAFGGRDTGRFAYKLDADTTLLTFGLNYGINQGNSIDGSLELLNSDAGSVSYERTVLRLSYLAIF